MAVKITVGHTLSAPNKISKTFVTNHTYSCVFKGATGMDSHDPVVLISGADAEDFRGRNYAKVATDTGNFGYYYITNVTAPRDDLVELALSLDVLMTYKDQIYEATALIGRSDGAYNLYLNDPYIDILSYNTIDNKNIDDYFGDSETIIGIVIGE